jgi:hypothetical protein
MCRCTFSMDSQHTCDLPRHVRTAVTAITCPKVPTWGAASTLVCCTRTCDLPQPVRTAVTAIAGSLLANLPPPPSQIPCFQQQMTQTHL